MKSGNSWADEVNEASKVTARKESKTVSVKAYNQPEWIYKDAFRKKDPKNLVYRGSKKRVNIVEKLFEYIMEERYGNKMVFGYKKPREAFLVLEDYQAGRPVEGSDRSKAMSRIAKKLDSALEDWKEQKARTV